LKRNREERVFIAFGSASEHGKNLFGVRHSIPFVPNLTTALAFGERVFGKGDSAGK
jgi:hypothetical protein